MWRFVGCASIFRKKQPTEMAESIGAQMVGRKMFPLGKVMTKLAGIVRT